MQTSCLTVLRTTDSPVTRRADVVLRIAFEDVSKVVVDTCA